LSPAGRAAHAGEPYVIEWARQYGTSGCDYARAVCVDALGSVFVGGYTGGSLVETSAGGLDAVVARFDSAGHCDWMHQIGRASCRERV